MMRKVVLILSLMFISINAQAKEDLDIYKKELAKCDVVFKSNAEKSKTIYEQRMSAYSANRCYHNVAEKIIDKYYAKNSKKLKEKFDKFANVNFDIQSDIYELRDYCNPTCGSMVQVFYATKSAKLFKNLVFELILAVETFND